MRTPVKIASFGGALAVAFGGALGVGAAVGHPLSPAGDGHGQDHSAGAAELETTDATSMTDAPTNDSTRDGHGDRHGDADPARVAGGPDPVDVPGGLMVSERGYTLDLVPDVLPAGPGAPLAFRILRPDGQPVTSYQQSHDEDLHLIAVRRDTTGFQHVHPERAPDGTWTAPLDLDAGSWRVFADFVPGEGDATGDTLTLGADLDVAGNYEPMPLPGPTATAEVDGYTVTLDGGLVPGQESELTLSVSRGGLPVTDLQPYLAAYGHLVALRDGDLAYLHVHPAGEPGDGMTQPGPDITFYATAPSPGDYRLFLDFQHQGTVRTAELTARADGPPTSSTSSSTSDASTDGTSDPTSGATSSTTDAQEDDAHADDGHDH